MGMGNREKNFQRYLERHFGITLPPGIGLFYTKGVRIGNDEIKGSHIQGELGYAACDFGFNPTHAFIQNFGHLAKKNVVRVTQEEACRFVKGENLAGDLGKGDKYVVLKYDGHVLGLGHYRAQQRKIMNTVPPGLRREIVNTI